MVNKDEKLFNNFLLQVKIVTANNKIPTTYKNIKMAAVEYFPINDFYQVLKFLCFLIANAIDIFNSYLSFFFFLLEITWNL